MKIKSFFKNIFLKIGLDIKFVKKYDVPTISADEIKKVNNNNLHYIKSLPLEEINKRINSITIREPMNSSSFSNIKSILDKEGIVVFKDILEDSYIYKLRDEINKIIKDIKKIDPEGSGYETDNYLVSGRKKLGDSYYDLSNYSKPVVHIRQGNDQGMIDVFNVDKLLGKSCIDLNKLFLKDWLINSIQQSNKIINPKNLNLYINHSIIKTNGFHVDSNYRSIKAFVYLTDVNNLEDGPYTYVKGTHVNVDDVYKKVNIKMTKTKEAPFFDLQSVVPILGKKGTLIISDQSGIHRGFPQTKGSIREVLVMRYA